MYLNKINANIQYIYQNNLLIIGFKLVKKNLSGQIQLSTPILIYSKLGSIK